MRCGRGRSNGRAGCCWTAGVDIAAAAAIVVGVLRVCGGVGGGFGTGRGEVS